MKIATQKVIGSCRCYIVIETISENDPSPFDSPVTVATAYPFTESGKKSAEKLFVRSILDGYRKKPTKAQIEEALFDGVFKEGGWQITLKVSD